MEVVYLPRILSIDIETYSSAPLPKCGVYRYSDAPDFEILLFSYAYNDEPVQTIDLACGEHLPSDVLSALDDPDIHKYAYSAAFERVCLSKYLGHWLDPAQWRCSAVMASYLTLPARLGDVAVALNLTEKKMEEGKDLIRYFSVPCKPTKANDGRIRNLPRHAPDKWAVYRQYNAQDVETERAVRKALEAYPLPDHEWELYALDQRINDRGVRVDRLLVKQAMAVDQAFSTQAFLRAKELTGLDNPGSVSQLKAWLADQDMPMESLTKRIVQEKAKDADGIVGELLNLRLDLSKTSVKKYEAMARTVCRDGRVHGLLQFGGASRTYRWAGRLVQIQNLPQNHLPDLSLARDIVKTGDEEQLELLFGSVPSTLSELIRTAFIPKDGCRFIVADFSAIEARVLAWLAGEEWVLEEFRGRGKIYEATASRMFHVSAESIVKGNPNYEYRQKGKQAVLSCGYGGGVGALKKMGAKMPEEEMQPLVDAWRAANPCIVAFWRAMDRAACKVIKEQTSARIGRVALYWRDDKMLMRLPSGRNLCYLSPRITQNRFGNDSVGFLAPIKNGQLVLQETWGATLVENATQAIARDLLAHGMMNLEAAGYPIVFHVHDEAVMEVPIGQGSVEEACAIMARAPAWAEGLPLRADGDDGLLFYRKM
jgi:DNA polymerase